MAHVAAVSSSAELRPAAAVRVFNTRGKALKYAILDVYIYVSADLRIHTWLKPGLSTRPRRSHDTDRGGECPHNMLGGLGGASFSRALCRDWQEAFDRRAKVDGRELARISQWSQLGRAFGY